jgi:hypothetical protein
MDTRFKTTFAAQIRAIDPDENTRNEAKASLSRLRDLLPASINPEDEPALLFVAGNLAVAGYVNLNDDGLDIETALQVYKKFERQQINVEHDRKAVVGYIVHAGLSELGTDRVITEEEARAAGKPFNIAVVLALWRAVNKDLCNYIEEASSPTHPDFNALSLSFEVGFENHRVAAIAKGNPVIADAAMVVKSDDAGFARYDAALRTNKGDGLSPDDANLRVYRIIDEGVVPLGGGIVTVPAAAVKGLVAITQTPVEAPVEVVSSEEDAKRIEADKQAAQMALALEEARNTALALFTHIEKKLGNLINLSETRVSPITSTNSSMNHINELKASLSTASKITKLEDLVAVLAGVNPIIDAITAESERQEAARKAAEAQAAEVEKTKAELQATAEKAAADLAVVKTELEQIKAAQAAAAAEEAFQNRMSLIEATFDFADDERALIVPDIKNLSDEAFAKKMEDMKKLFKEKTKEFKKKKDEECKAAQAALVAKLNEKGVKASFKDDGSLDEVIASAIAAPTSAPAGTIEQPQNTGDLKELATKALSTMTIGGKKNQAK